MSNPEPAVTEALRELRDLHSSPDVIRPVDDDGVQHAPIQVCSICGRYYGEPWPCETLKRIDALAASLQPASPGEGER